MEKTTPPSGGLAHHAEHDGKSEAGTYSCGLGRKEGIENSSENRLRNARAVVDDLEKDTVVRVPRRPQADGSRFSFLHDGLARVSDQIHQHLLQLAGVARDERKRRVEVQFEAYFFGGRTEALQFHSAQDHLIERNSFALRAGLAGAQKKLPQDGAGSFRFLVNLARFFRTSGEVFSHQEAL